MAKTEWLNTVIKAMQELGGTSELAPLYAKVEQIRRRENLPLNDSIPSTVRGTIEAFSSDSEVWKKKNTNRSLDNRTPDLFRKLGKGRWALRKNTTENIPDTFIDKIQAEYKSGKYSDFEYELSDQYRQFQQKFSPNILNALNGKTLIDKLFGGKKNNSMCYQLEALLDDFGSIWGGSAGKFQLYAKGENTEQWGNKNNEIISETVAISIGTDIRDKILKGCAIIDTMIKEKPNINFADLHNQLLRIDDRLFELGWIRKYLHMIYPKVFPTWYTEEKIDNILSLCNKETATNDLYVKLGILNEIAQSCKIPNAVFAKIATDLYTNNYNNDIRYWLYSPGEQASKWEEFYSKGIMAIAWDWAGDLTRYKTKDDIDRAIQIHDHGEESESANSGRGHVRSALWDFCNEMKPGDIIFAKNGKRTIVGRGVVISDYRYDANAAPFVNIRDIQWESAVNIPTYNHLPMKTLTNITKDTNFVEELENLFNKAKRKVYNNNSTISKNIIMYGAPGVGKSYSTIIKAVEIIDKKDSSWFDKMFTNSALYTRECLPRYNELIKNDQIKFLTFHQSLSYEEFIEGIRPTLNSDQIKYNREDGIFKEICDTARKNPESNYVLIIDEINRGNISKIFGELITLIEDDKREGECNQLSTILPYSKQRFSVPSNLYIVGTMNTADRSIQSIDIALRRRFQFIEMEPKSELISQNICGIDARKLLDSLNEKIAILLDADHKIGHSYFIKCDSIEAIKQVWFDKIIPLINEYFYGDWKKLKLILKDFVAEKDVSESLKEELADDKYYSFKHKKDFDSDAKFIEAIQNCSL